MSENIVQPCTDQHSTAMAVAWAIVNVTRTNNDTDAIAMARKVRDVYVIVTTGRDPKKQAD